MSVFLFHFSCRSLKIYAIFWFVCFLLLHSHCLSVFLDIWGCVYWVVFILASDFSRLTSLSTVHFMVQNLIVYFVVICCKCILYCLICVQWYGFYGFFHFFLFSCNAVKFTEPKHYGFGILLAFVSLGDFVRFMNSYYFSISIVCNWIVSELHFFLDRIRGHTVQHNWLHVKHIALDQNINGIRLNCDPIRMANRSTFVPYPNAQLRIQRLFESFVRYPFYYSNTPKQKNPSKQGTTERQWIFFRCIAMNHLPLLSNHHSQKTTA